MSECCSVQDQVLILGCSGGSNVGQIANQAGIELERGGLGRMKCAVGVAAGIDGLVAGASKASHLIAIDGCAVGCVKAGLAAQAGREPDTYIVVTELGVAKNRDFDLKAEEVALTVTATRRAMGLAE
ncbi:MAG: putative zinc-binding protein [Armatimonadetes bacterium]|nr:putative zinc-binding protein [Armatimonadota bacterium]